MPATALRPVRTVIMQNDDGKGTKNSRPAGRLGVAAALILGLAVLGGGSRASLPALITPRRFVAKVAPITTRLLLSRDTGYVDIFVRNQTIPTFAVDLGRDRASAAGFLKKHAPSVRFEVRPSEESNAGDLTALVVVVAVGVAMMAQGARDHGGPHVTPTRDLLHFADVAGLEDQKTAVLDIAEMFQHREAFIGNGVRVPRGVLFYGSPGTGKTMLARALAQKTGVAFFQCCGSDFCELYVGVGARRVRNLFATARAHAPSIVFIDELDAVGSRRGGTGGASARERDATLNTLLTELDLGAENGKHVLVLAATNFVDALDAALTRAGRFDRKIAFTLPTKQQRADVFALYFRKTRSCMPSDDTSALALEMAERTPQLSYADIAAVCNEAGIAYTSARLTAPADRAADAAADPTADPALSFESALREALDDIVLGRRRSALSLGPGERRVVAFHEAGHAVVAWALAEAAEPVAVSIAPRGRSALGYTRSAPRERQLRGEEEWLADICVLLGGRTSEEIFCGSASTGAADDLQKATAAAAAYVVKYAFDSEPLLGYDRPDLSDASRNTADRNVATVLAAQRQRARVTLQNNEKTVRALAAALLQHNTVRHTALASLFARERRAAPPTLSAAQLH